MNRFILFILVVVISGSCISKNEQQALKSGKELYFAESTYDYGQIEQDSDGLYKITFKNLGDEAIIINKVRSSCGCTIPSWPKNPIEPGAGGEIEVKYNTALPGAFMKSIHVYSSAANSPVKLVVKGKVIPKEKTD